jgi:hypothetical protein
MESGIGNKSGVNYRAVVRILTMSLFVFSVFSSLARADDSFIIVSDVDDTVKITNVLNLGVGVLSESVFAGMPELYQQLLGNDSPAERLWFLSGSPKIMNHRVKEILNDTHFPKHELTLRNGKQFFKNIFDFKTKKMEKKYGTSTMNFILIGDDTESDPKVYATFSAPRPNQVLAVYIHRITGSALPPGSISFVTAYDIAMHEYVSGRLNEAQAAVVGKAVLDAKDKNFLPRFQGCPKEPVQVTGLPETLVKLKGKIDERVKGVCLRRAKK